MNQVTTNRPSDTSLRGSYDREAAQYDEKRYQAAEGRLFSELEVTLLRSWLDLNRGKRLLDMPTGTGRLSAALSETGASVWGVDVSLNMLRRAAQKRVPGHSMHLIQGSGVDLPFPDETFDSVVCFKFFHLISNDRKPAFIREMARVLIPGGSLVVEFNSPYYGGVLAFLRYYLRKRRPGGMRMKCLYPDQISSLFAGLDVVRIQGVKLPFSSLLTVLFGKSAIERLNSFVGRTPGVRYLSYAIVVEARKRISSHEAA